MARRTISPERQTLYYVGMAIALLGLLSFASTFLSAALNFGNFDNFEARGRSMALRAFGGMAMIVIGGALSNIGTKGVAGSGLVLDPKRSREDLEPWSRFAGGMVGDALNEAGIDLGDDPDADLRFDEKLRRLHELYTDGILSLEEYEQEKRELLDSN